jgi:hypothetical protein
MGARAKNRGVANQAVTWAGRPLTQPLAAADGPAAGQVFLQSVQKSGALEGVADVGDG